MAAGAASLFGGDNTVENYVSNQTGYGTAEDIYNQAVAARDAAVAAVNQTNNISITINDANNLTPAAVARAIADAVAAGIKNLAPA